MKLIKIFSFFLLLGGIYFLSPPPSFATNVKIVDYQYFTHWTPGQIPSFTLSAKNNDAVINEVYFAVVLTNHSSGQEVTVGGEYPRSPDTLISAGTSKVMAATQVQWTSTSGLYTVTLILYKTAGGNELDRVYGKEPVHVGNTMDSVAAFPKILDMGAMQYGRYMHPVPIEISWDFFSYSSQIRNDHPWYMRIYTDNHKRYKGIDGAIYSGRVATQEGGSASAAGSPAGLVSSDGKYSIPLKVWCLNFGPDVEEGWDPSLMGPPPVKEDYYWKGPLLDNQKRDSSRVAWEWIPDYVDMTADNGTWRKLIGQDPYDTHYASDSNPTGDFTLASPFQIFIGYEASPTAVEGKYWTDLIIELYSP